MDSASLWDRSVAAFCDDVAQVNPAPAAVAVSCVAAEMGLSLVVKVLRITGRRKSFAGDIRQLNALIEAAQEESRMQRQAADDDVAAVRAFIGSHDPAAARTAVEVPMRAARSIARGVDLCAAAAALIQGLPAADLGAGAILLAAALRAILLSVDFNLRLLDPDDPGYAASIRAERHSLEEQVRQATARW